MKLKKLIKEIPIVEIKGSKEIEITGVCSNSKLVAPGNLFIAKKGLTTDGSRFIPEAIIAGATAILTDIYDPSLKNVTQIICKDISKVEGQIAAEYNRQPSEKMLMIGITGTNGKTTTSYLVKHILDLTYTKTGLIGTIEYIMGKMRYKATHTTPDVTTNQKILREMLSQGINACVMETTSHGLDQGRVNNIDFDLAIFTNLSLDHLDYHNSMQKYLLAKKKLFLSLHSDKKKGYPKVAIVNADDPNTREIVKGLDIKVLTYGIEKDADLQAFDIKFTSTKTKFRLRFEQKVTDFSIPMVGRFNVYNSLAAISSALCLNVSLEKISKALRSFTSVQGRLELIPNDLNLKIYVDFAHTPDALQNVLKCLKEVGSKRLITVFGCGGNRDRQKRPIMAKICEKYSDLSIVTSDNPRNEDSNSIIQEIIKGFKKRESFIVEPDRKAAIMKAVKMAAFDDIILIAGRGHESYQTFAHHTVEFNDCQVVKDICVRGVGK